MIVKLKLWIAPLLIIFPTISNAYTFDLPLKTQLAISGYLGYKQIFSNVHFDIIESEPELGLILDLKLSNNLHFFNQFQYGRTINEILTYNFLSYNLNINNDFNIVFKVGKIRYNFGLYNSTRVNPRTRQGVFQPQAIYFDKLDHTLDSGLGIGIDTNYRNFKFTYMIDKPNLINREEQIGLGQQPTKDFLNQNTSSFTGHQEVTLEYNYNDITRYKIGWDKLKVSYVDSNYYSLGVEHTLNDKFLVSAETIIKQPLNKNGIGYGMSTTGIYNFHPMFSLRANWNQYNSPASKHQIDYNLGINFHRNSYMANLEGHYIRGGSLVDHNELVLDSRSFDNYYVIGMNFAYFFN